MCLIGLADYTMMNGETDVMNKKVTRRFVTEVLEEKNKRLNDLKAQEVELLQKLGE